MDYNFLKVATSSPYIKICDCFFNAKNIIKSIKEAFLKKTSLILFPELCITGYTCSDLFFQSSLLKDSLNALKLILENTKDLNIIAVIGMPIEYNNKLYNCGVCIYKGAIKGIVCKNYLPTYSEFYEKRYFNTLDKDENINIFGQNIPFSNNLIFNVCNIPNFKFSIEICEDLWSVSPPSNFSSVCGALIVLNLSASNEIAGKEEYRKALINVQSSKCICAYLYANAGEGESTTDVVFSGHSMIYENGICLKESNKFKNETIYADIDLELLSNERKKNTTFFKNFNKNILQIDFEMDKIDFDIERYFEKYPFVPADDIALENLCEEILQIQAYALKKRLEHINTKIVVVGISGGLDSTLALLAIDRAFDILNYDKKGIIAVTMPCFGTSSKTYENAKKLCQLFNTTFLEINIKNSVLQHFKDIGQNENMHDVTFENSQARERTQVLMDLANKHKGIVIGTGDLSELALGFATYNGDHMSMYNINCSIPKTLIKHLISYIANKSKPDLKNLLIDIIDTPISPELIPTKQDGNISQITEDVIGPYALNDFFLYHFLKNNFSPEKIYFLAKKTFENMYNKEVILKHLKNFYIRFFTQQFKRSCAPDGIKVLKISLSPRSDFKMPSDASYKAFLDRLDNLNI